MRELDGMRILGPGDGEIERGRGRVLRELVVPEDTGGRWGLGEITAEPSEKIRTHVHPGEAEAFVILEGIIELHGAHGVAELHPGDVVLIPPDTEHGLRAPAGGRWIAVWPTREQVPGSRYTPSG